MAWYKHLWPWGQEHREKILKVEKDFKDQLEQALERQGDLQEAVDKIREDRELRQIESLRKPRIQPQE